MIIEVSGVSFVNKGAELMLHAILQQVKKWDETDTIIALDLRSGNFQQRRDLGLYNLAWIDSRKFPFAGPLLDKGVGFLPTSLRNSWRWVGNSQSEAIFDAGGFVHSDQFGSLNSELLLNRYQQAKDSGKKIILLPQAFGPFLNEQVASVVSKIIDLADLVYARDSMSYEHIVGLNGSSPHIKIAPDFTNLVSTPFFKVDDKVKNQPCIIPNSRMIEKTEPEIRTNYVSFLVHVVQYLQDKSLAPFLLIHETESDYPLAQAIQNNLDTPIIIVQEANALNIKSLIGQSLITISSRYHGLINGLAQSIPSLATGWSHKYQMLLEDYNCPQYLVSPLTPECQVYERLNEMLEEPNRTELIKNLQKANERLIVDTKNMWSEVHTILYS